MFLINGSIKCSDIDYGTNSFYIYHDFGFVRSSTKSFSFDNDGVIEQFRPAYVTFGDGFIKVSLGSYRFNQNGTIHYSFTALNLEKVRILSTTPELYARLKIVEDSILYAKTYVKQVIPGDVIIKSDIEFNTIQNNISPKFYWDTPVRNSEASNSSSANDTEIKIVGYYYAFNKNDSYFITKVDSYVKESSNSESTHVYVRFPTSGTYYFHIRAVNSVGEVSRNTSHAKVIYNDPPTTPTGLMNNGHSYYYGSSNINLLSWEPSKNGDEDEINYEILIYKNDELFHNGYIKALKCYESDLYVCVDVDGNYGFSSKLNVMHLAGKILYGRLKVVEDSNSYSDSYSYPYYESNSSSESYSNEEYGVFTDMATKKRDTSRLYYIYDKKIENNKAGSYRYVLRAYDWAEQSEWSHSCYYDIVDKHLDIYSKMWVGYNFEHDFGINPIFGQLFVKGDTWFFGYMYIIPKLICKIRICQLYEDTPFLHATLRFKYYDTLYCKINIDTNFSDLYGMLNIRWVPSQSFLYAKTRVVEQSWSELWSRFNFVDFGDNGFYGATFVRANGTYNFYGFLEVIRERMCGKLNILRRFSNDSNYDRSRLICKMMVDNYPPEPKITCTVGHDWQNESVVTFFWTIEENNVKVVAYEYLISTKPISDFSDKSFARTFSTEVTMNLANYNADSEYYFYIRTVGDNGSYSNPSVYVVKYNNKPSVPSYPMYVNNKESINNIPVISRSEYNEFKWPKSTHLDNDTVKYNIQISNKSDFSNIIIDVDEISNIDDTLDISTKIKYDYSLSNPVYYWRVRAYDRHEYTDFGYTGRFKCNTKPGVPTNLSVSNEV